MLASRNAFRRCLARAVGRAVGQALGGGTSSTLTGISLATAGLRWLKYLRVREVHGGGELVLAVVAVCPPARRQPVDLQLIGLGVLVGLTEVGPWPHSLVGVPGQVVSNTEPPHLPLVALAAFQFGGIMLIEGRLARLLAGSHLWTVTVLVNGMIMTIFLWHSTVMMLSFGSGIWLGGIGLEVIPGTSAWWWTRLAWVAVFAVALLPVVGVFSRFERPSTREALSPAPWRMVLGSGFVVVGLALLASGGIGGTGPLGLRLIPILLTLGGAEVGGVGVIGSLAVATRVSTR